jgi:hypothetical protein
MDETKPKTPSDIGHAKLAAVCASHGPLVFCPLCHPPHVMIPSAAASKAKRAAKPHLLKP